MAENFIEAWKSLAGIAHYDARELAKLCAISLRQLERNFNRELNRSPQDWLNEQRIEAARQLLLSGGPVKRVAFELGYKQVSHFCRQFKAYNHMTPSQFLHDNNVTVSLIDNKCRSQIIVGG
jgi:AraC-like DNA-binding protein